MGEIGSDNKSLGVVLELQGLGEMKDNGERITKQCATGNLVIEGSFFHHRSIHKAM